MKKTIFSSKELFTLILIFSISINKLSGQDMNRAIEFPNVNNLLTLKCDFHIHTVFSDGKVWPSIRVDEAIQDGLDAIALTEHIEYQPHQADIPHPDRNRSYEIAKEYAKARDLLVIHGTEITRSMPPGHANAIFVQDVNKINVKDPVKSYKAARAQGAFIFWNHPNWMNQQKDGVPVLSEMHEMLIKEDLLHGIEVVNDLTYSEEALNIAIEHDLTVIGTSDIHGLVDYQFNLANGGHRPIMLVFAKEKSENAIKEALFAGKTVTWFDNILSGKKENLEPLVNSCLKFTNKGYIGNSEVLQLGIINDSDARFIIQNKSVYEFYKNGDLIEIPPHAEKEINVLVAKSENDGSPIVFDVLNAVIAPKKFIQLEIDISN